ncbi:MAG: PD40 domain-containing protein, partial [Acidobacteria bacterium]|nr:PD40 domain-containing protein [Acidobacteriota bacterium]
SGPDRKPVLLFQSEFDKDQPAVSPDGRWVAYNSSESGRWEVYVASFPGFTERRQISNSSGCQPLWRKDGKELFYLTLEAKVMAMDIKPAATPEAGLPRELFAVPLRVNPTGNQYAVTGDGRKFFFLESLDEGPVPITVTLNWTTGLTR